MTNRNKNINFRKINKRFLITIVLSVSLVFIFAYAITSFVFKKIEGLENLITADLSLFSLTIPNPSLIPSPISSDDFDFSDDPNIINPPNCIIDDDCPIVTCYGVLCNKPGFNLEGKCEYTPSKRGQQNCPQGLECNGKGKCDFPYTCFDVFDCMMLGIRQIEGLFCDGDDIYETGNLRCIDPGSLNSYCILEEKFVKDCDPDSSFSSCKICRGRELESGALHAFCPPDDEGLKDGRSCKLSSGETGKCQKGECKPFTTPTPIPTYSSTPTPTASSTSTSTTEQNSWWDLFVDFIYSLFGY